jgi:chromosome segregation ATPase
LLSRVVDDADALARKSGMLSNRDAEVVAMLTGPSIKLPVISVPVQQRGLLDNSERQGVAEPRAVLESMIKAFDVARSTVAAIDSADNALKIRTGALRRTIDELKNWSSAEGFELDLATLPALENLESDPLRALDQIAAAEKSIETLSARRAAIVAEIANFEAMLGKATAALAELRTAIGAAKTLATECASAFEGGTPALDPLAERSPAELETWLETLRATRKAHRLKAALIGLSKWEEVRAGQAKAVRMTTDACRRLVAAREDTLGRLRALRAKGQALAATRTSPPSLLALEVQAKTATRRTPYAPAGAEAAVKAYEDALAAAARQV